jgi:threonine dehydrogenase-like Zn-dependent dehydrogenase
MQAIGVFPGRRAVGLIDHPPPAITSPTQIRFRTLEVGVCGTDKEICTFVYGAPPTGFDYLVLGHEGLGEVVDAGSAVTRFKPGDLVVPTVRRPCADPRCRPCRLELQDFCATGEFTERGIKMTHGFMTEFVVEEEKYLHPVPAELHDVAVLVEPLTVAEKGLAQLWKVQQRLPWTGQAVPDKARAQGLRAVVLGAGPVGILGTMTLLAAGFETYVYSRSKPPNPKSNLVESIGVPYLSCDEVSPEKLAERIGNIDVIYEAVGTADIAFRVLKVLGINGAYIFTGIPPPRAGINVEADNIMRNLVLKNQVAIGTVNADADAFAAAIRDLAVFKRRWPEALRALITRFRLRDYRDLLLGAKSGIKNVIAVA